jgi:hypothetical protein
LRLAQQALQVLVGSGLHKNSQVSRVSQWSCCSEDSESHRNASSSDAHCKTVAACRKRRSGTPAARLMRNHLHTLIKACAMTPAETHTYTHTAAAAQLERMQHSSLSCMLASVSVPHH